jgi:hypothetical protein
MVSLSRKVITVFQLSCTLILALASAQSSKAQSSFNFVPVTPCRIADTRNANGLFGGPSLAGQSTRNFPVPGSSCNIPTTAAAYSLNVTVVPNGTLGYISIWATGQAQPLASTLNSIDGRIKSDAAIVPAGTGGGISVFATDTTDVILDINGYFVPTTVPGALAFYQVTPCRVADTRNVSGTLGGPSLAGGQTRSFPVLSVCNIPSSAQAYSLNFTAIPQGTLGYLSVWPTGQSQPLVSTLNAPTGTVTANAAIVPAGTGGAINLYATNSTDIVIDINGYFAPPGPGGLSFSALTPCRTLDTRQGGVQPFTGTLNVNVTGFGCNVPTAGQAYVFNSTVVPPGALGYLTLWPEGTAQPLVSTLNALDGSITSNMAIVPATNGSISAFASSPTQLILDISGYLAPQLMSLGITPSLALFKVGNTQQFSAIATYSDGSTQDVSSEAAWSSANIVPVGLSAPNVLGVSSSGLATALSSGKAQVSAQVSNAQASAVATAGYNYTYTNATSLLIKSTPAFVHTFNMYAQTVSTAWLFDSSTCSTSMINTSINGPAAGTAPIGILGGSGTTGSNFPVSATYDVATTSGLCLVNLEGMTITVTWN